MLSGKTAMKRGLYDRTIFLPAVGRYRFHFVRASREEIARGCFLAFGLCLVLSCGLFILRDHLSTANVALLYLLPILVGAITGGLIPGVLTAIASAVSFSALFMGLHHALFPTQEQDALTLIFYLATAVLVAELAGYAHAHVEASVRRAVASDQLYDLSSVFLAGDLATMMEALVARLGTVFTLQTCVILVPDTHGTLQRRAHWGHPLGASSPDDKRQLDAVATWAFTQGDVVGFSLDRPAPANSIRRGSLGHRLGVGTKTPAKETILFLPLRTGQVRGGQHTTGVLGLARPVSAPFTQEETRVLRTFATQAALAIDRGRLAEESAQAAILRESDLAKSTLLSNVSHDLRTPLTTIRGAAESLLAPDVRLDEQTRQELLTSIRDESDRLTALVGNLLNLSRLEAGALRIEQHLYNLSEIAGRVVARMRPQMTQHRLELALLPDVPPVLVDYALIDQVLTNLLDNAVKYSPEGTTVVVSLRREGDQAVLSVADNGPGIPRNARNRVFERFYRLPETTARQVPGTGLGLAICHAVVTAHGGRIWIDDRAQTGTTMSIALPIPPEPPELDLSMPRDAR